MYSTEPILFVYSDNKTSSLPKVQLKINFQYKNEYLNRNICMTKVQNNTYINSKIHV